MKAATHGFELPVKCPFCDAPIGVTVGDDGLHDGIIHGMPMCDVFKTHGPLAYIRAVNAALGLGPGNDNADGLSSDLFTGIRPVR